MATDLWCTSALSSHSSSSDPVEQSPQKSEICFRHLVENTPGIIYRYRVYADGRGEFVYMSPRCREVYGLEPEDFLQRPARFWDVVHPDDARRVRQAIAQALQHSQPLNLEHRIITPEGQTRWVQVLAQPELQPGGNRVWNGFVTNITARKQAEQQLAEHSQTLAQQVQERTADLKQEIAERKQAEAALRQNETTLRETLQAIPDLIVWTDSEGRCLEYFTGDEVKVYAPPKPADVMYDLLPPELAATRRTVVQRALQTGKLQLCEQQIMVDGELRYEEVRVVAVSANRVLVIVRDITKRKRLEEKRQQFEVALKAQQAFLRQVIDTIPCMVFVRDRQGNYIMLNKMCAHLYGVPTEDLLGRNELDLNLVSPQQFQEFITTNQEVMTTLESKVVTGQAIANIHGETRWYQTLLNPFFDSAGQVQGVIGSLIDISHLKQTEAALRQSKETAEAATAELHALFAAMDDLILVLDREGRYLAAPSAKSRNLFELHLQHFNPPHPKELDPVRANPFEEHIQRCLQSQQTIKIQYRLPIDQQEVWCDTSVSPIDGDRVLWVCRDITIQKQIEAELQTQKDYLRQVIDVVPNAIYVKDLEGRVLTVNQAGAAMYGLSVEERIGTTDATLSPNLVEAFDQSNEIVIATRQPRIVWAEPVRLANGEQRWYHTIINPFLDSAGQVRGVVGASIDITDLKHTQEELRQAKDTAEAANRAKSTFLANMSHELRTPLNAILGFSQLMSQDANLSSQQRNNLRAIRQSGEHLLRLINQVLELCKSEAGHATLHRTDFNLHQLLADVEGMFLSKAQTKGVLLKTELDPAIPLAIQTDRVKLQQVLINLLSNAIKFTASGSVLLRVSCGYDELNSAVSQDFSTPSLSNHSASNHSVPCWLCFEVVDTGVGINPEEFEQLFEAFVQAEAGRQAQEGTGLGLAISQHFVELMGGSIQVRSRGQCFSPGGGFGPVSDPDPTSTSPSGTAFRFALPVKPLTGFPDRQLGSGELSESDVCLKLERSLTQSSSSKMPAQPVRFDFARLPSLWSQQFKQALVEGDLVQMVDLIEQLSIEQPLGHSDATEAVQSVVSKETIQYLLALVKRYQFEQLLTLISPLAEA